MEANKKRKLVIVITLLVFVLSIIALFSKSFSNKNVVEEKYNYDNSRIETYFKDNKEINIDDILKDKTIGSYDIGPGEKVKQEFNAPMGNVQFIKFAFFQKPTDISDLKMTIIDDDGKTKAKLNIQKINDLLYIATLPTDYMYGASDRICIKNNSYETLKMFARYKEKGSTIGGQFVDIEAILGFNGNTRNVGIGKMLAAMCMSILSGSGLIYLLVNFKEDRKKIKVNIFTYAIEFVLSVIFALTMLLLIIKVNYSTFGFTKNAIISCVMGIVLMLYAAKMYASSDKKPEQLFLIIAIPISVIFWLFMLPDTAPDETAHFAKIYLTANGIITSNSTVHFPKSYRIGMIGNYYDLYSLIMTPTDYAETYTINIASGIPIYAYFPQVAFYLISKLLGLPILVGYYFAKLGNMLVFLLMGYYIVKTTPIAKYLFIAYMLSPIFLQQSVSASGDMVLNINIAFFVAYVLKVKYSDEPLSWKNIFVVSFCFFITMNTKYAYAPLYGILLLWFDKFKEDKFKKVLPLLGLMALGAASYFAYNAIFPRTTGIEGFKSFLQTRKVNSNLQMKYLKEHPFVAFDIIGNTLNEFGERYALSIFGSFLGPCRLELNTSIAYLYGFVLLVLAVNTATKFKVSVVDKIIMLFFSAVSAIAVLMGMYLIWTAVADNIIMGVQGRYFLPIEIIFLMVLVTKHKKIKESITVNRICIGYVIVYDLMAIISFITYICILGKMV